MNDANRVRWVLVVEDDPRSRRLMSEMLRDAGYLVVEAESGEGALREIDRPQAIFDLAVLDIQMPGMDGCAVAREIRRREQWVKLPLLAVTGLASPADVTRVLEAGCDAYLSKPVILPEVRALAAQLIADADGDADARTAQAANE